MQRISVKPQVRIPLLPKAEEWADPRLNYLTIDQHLRQWQSATNEICWICQIISIKIEFVRQSKRNEWAMLFPKRLDEVLWWSDGNYKVPYTIQFSIYTFLDFLIIFWVFPYFLHISLPSLPLWLCRNPSFIGQLLTLELASIRAVSGGKEPMKGSCFRQACDILAVIRRL